MILIANIIHKIVQILTFFIIIQVVLSYFLPPYNSIRRMFDAFLAPLYRPIRRLLPQTGMVDFSPLILILVIQIFDVIIQNILFSF